MTLLRLEKAASVSHCRSMKPKLKKLSKVHLICLCPISLDCFLLSSCLPPLILSVPLVSPSLFSLSLMLLAWKVPGLSVRCSIFCRALVAGTVPQKVSRFQLPLRLFSLPSLLPSFFFFLGAHRSPHASHQCC